MVEAAFKLACILAAVCQSKLTTAALLAVFKRACVCVPQQQQQCPTDRAKEEGGVEGGVITM